MWLQRNVKQIARYDPGSRVALSRLILALMILLQLYTMATCHSPSSYSDVALVPLPHLLPGRHHGVSLRHIRIVVESFQNLLRLLIFPFNLLQCIPNQLKTPLAICNIVCSSLVFHRAKVLDLLARVFDFGQAEGRGGPF